MTQPTITTKSCTLKPNAWHIKLATAVAGALVLSACNQATSNQSPTEIGDDVRLLNVSYDVSRDFYKDYNTLFAKDYKAAHPDSKVHINQSHGGSSKQALSVANGLQADVVTLNQNTDMNLLVKKGLVDAEWQQAFPNNAVPYTSTMVLLVRKDNPKQIKDWQDLARTDVKVVMPNPKTSGTARYAFLGAYGYGLHAFNEDAHSKHPKTDAYMQKLLGNVVTYDKGSRAATTSFLQRDLGDVLITTENEAHLVASQYGKGQVELIYPSYSILISNPVAIVTGVTQKNGNTKAAKAYLDALWQDDAQALMAEMYLRPSNAQILAKHKDTLPAITTFVPTEVFGSWETIMDTFFVDGGRFDSLAQSKAPQS